jgi:hypothetical protein
LLAVSCIAWLGTLSSIKVHIRPLLDVLQPATRHIAVIMQKKSQSFG